MVRKKSKGVLIRLTEDEHERLLKIIEKSNLSQQEFCRRAVFDEKIVIIEGLFKFTDELNRIGNNLNQLTKAVHQNELRGLYASFDDLNKELVEAWRSLKEFLRWVKQQA